MILTISENTYFIFFFYFPTVQQGENTYFKEMLWLSTSFSSEIA